MARYALTGFLAISLCWTALTLSSCSQHSAREVEFRPSGELKERIERNFQRLESKKYQPANVFLTEEQSGGWPGDTEGRTILGLVCDSRAGFLHSDNLKEIIRLIPEHLNDLGYMGPDYGEVMDEQQFSGNGWMLRGLCAYYDYTGDSLALEMIRSISDSLFVRNAGKYRTYPILESELHKNGEASGRISDVSENWRLSSDVGCLFIGMDGLADAWRLIGGTDIESVLEEMAGRFLEMDLVELKAQTHASLTACRALVRIAELTGQNEYLDEVIKRWELYRKYGMTENYENYNWFRRYDTWTEPCAITDSFILALKLWKHTGKIEYLEEAHLIWYNAICHTQRSNGGFGCDTCPGEASGQDLAVHINEAHWCCTMRGAEALATAVETIAQLKGDDLYITAFHNGIIRMDDLQIDLNTDYPYPGHVTFTITEGRIKPGRLKIFLPGWMKVTDIRINDKNIIGQYTDDAFMSISRNLRKGDRLTVSYDFEVRNEPMMNIENTSARQHKRLFGPLILDTQDKPLHHLMNPEVRKEKGYRRQILSTAEKHQNTLTEAI